MQMLLLNALHNVEFISVQIQHDSQLLKLEKQNLQLAQYNVQLANHNYGDSESEI